MAVALPSSYANILQKLMKQLGVNLANYDYEEQGKRRGYNNSVVGIKEKKGSSLFNSSAGMADRGLTQSGVALQQATDISKAADKDLGTAAQGLSSDLSALARKRLTAQSDFNLRKAELERQAVGEQTPIAPPVAPRPVSAPVKKKAAASTSRPAPTTTPRLPAGYIQPRPVKRVTTPTGSRF